MRRLLFTIAVLAATQPAAGQQPEPIIRTVYDAENVIQNAVEAPGGRFVLIAPGNRLLLFDRQTKRVTATGLHGMTASWSPRGDWLAYSMAVTGENGNMPRVYARPMNPATAETAGPARRISMSTGGDPQFSPDGRTIAFHSTNAARNEFRIVLVPAMGGRERVIHTSDVQLQSPRWSHDGQWVYFTRTGPGAWQVFRVSATGGTPVLVGDGNSDVGLSADGRYIAQFPRSSGQGTLIIRDAQTGNEIARRVMPRDLRPTRWSVTGYKMIGVQRDVVYGLAAVSVEDGSARPFGIEGDRRPQYSPDGRQIVAQNTVNGRMQLVLLNANGSGRRVLPTAAQPVDIARWSPDGKHIAFLAEEPSGKVLMVVDVASGREQRLIETNIDPITRFDWLNDGRAIVISVFPKGRPREIREVSLDGSSKVLLTIDHPAAQLSADWLVNRNVPGQSTLESLRGAGTRTIFKEEGVTFLGMPAMSPDGRWIATEIRWPQGSGKGFTLELIPVDGSAPRRVTTGFEGCDMYGAYWHLGGRLLTADGSANCEQETSAIHLVSLTGGPHRNLTAKLDAPDVASHTFSPDGTTLMVEIEKRWSGKIVEIDLTPVLPRASNRN